MWSDLQRDLLYAIRVLKRRPLYLSSVALTLGVAIGGAAAVFTFVNGVLLRPLPYANPERLVKVCEKHPELPASLCLASPANLRDWAKSSRSLEALGLARDWPLTLKRDRESMAIRGGFATPEVFGALGVRPAIGRLFEERDLKPGSPAVALLSHAFWTREFGADAAVVGSRLRTDKLDAEVVGLLPEGFNVPELEYVEVWFSFPAEWLERRDWRGFLPLGRLRENVSLAQANSEMQTIADELARRHPAANEGYGAEAVSLHGRIVGSVRRPLWIFMSAVSLVLLIAVANVANLVLVRVSARRKEFAVRTVMGAGRGRLAWQLLAENGVLALAGAAVGMPLAWMLVRLVRILAPANLPRFEEAELDGSVLLFSLIATLFVCFCLAFVASRSGSGKLSEVLKEGRQGSRDRSGVRLRGLLVVAEVGMAVLLLIGAALLTRTLFNLLEWRPGFEVDHVASAFLSAPVDKYSTGTQVTELFRRTIEEAAALPGVVSAGAASAGPLFGGGDGPVRFLIESREPPASSADYPRANRYDMFPTYFSTLGIKLRQGRYFTDFDIANSPRVAIVNETAARRHWPGESPVGRRVQLMDIEREPVAVEIVGVVADVPPFRPDRSPEPEIYWPLAQSPRWGTTLVVRTAVEPETVEKSIRTRLAHLDPDLQMGRFRTLAELADRELIRPRFFLFLMGVFAAMALILATLGIYGVISSMASERTFEIAVRMALGADRGDILRLMLGRGMLLSLAGVAAGVGAAFVLAPLLSNLLVSVGPVDWISFGAAALLLSAACLLGSWAPARRASRVDPAEAMRLEPFA